jgi:hypothetical protein
MDMIRPSNRAATQIIHSWTRLVTTSKPIAAASNVAPLEPTVRVSATPMLAGQTTDVLGVMQIGSANAASMRATRFCELGWARTR